jgi:hypothetical protein
MRAPYGKVEKTAKNKQTNKQIKGRLEVLLNSHRKRYPQDDGSGHTISANKNVKRKRERGRKEDSKKSCPMTEAREAEQRTRLLYTR